jgi:hypothetical protein
MGINHNGAWFNITNSNSGIFYWDFDANGQNYTQGDTINICSWATGYWSNCYTSQVPAPNATIIVNTVPMAQNVFPNATNLTNQTIQPFTTFNLPNIIIINKSAYRDSINSTIIGNISQGLLNQVDEMYNSTNSTVIGTVSFALSPINMITNYWLVALSFFLQTFTSLTYLVAVPLQVTAMVINIIPWQIQSLITMGLSFDLIWLVLFGGK